jgi:outer membrane protein TolC
MVTQLFRVLALSLLAAQPSPAQWVQSRPPELTMQDAVAIGLERSFQLQRSGRNEQIAEERTKGAKAALGPHVDLGFRADQAQRYYDFRGAYDYNLAAPQFETGLSVNAFYDADISGSGKRSLQQARLSRQSSTVDVAQTAIDVSADIRSTYLQALHEQQQVTADGDFVELIDSLIARARAAQPTAVGFLESERSNAALTLEQTKQNSDLTLSSLRQILRLGADVPMKLTTSLPDPSPLPGRDRLLDTAYANRGDLKQTAIRLQQARIAKVQATDFRRPSLRASAFATQALNGDTFMLNGENHGRTRSVGVLVSLNLPLITYDGGQLASNRRIANIQADQAIADSEEAKERAENEINQALIGLDRAADRLKKLPNVDSARQSLAQAEQQMLAASPADAAGMLAQVSNARLNWKMSVTARNDALTAYYSQYYRLQRSLGTEVVR